MCVKMLESQADTCRQESLVSQAGFDESSYAVVADADGEGVHLIGEVGRQVCFAGGCLSGFGQSFLCVAHQIYTCCGRSVKFYEVAFEVNKFSSGQHEEVQFFFLDRSGRFSMQSQQAAGMCEAQVTSQSEAVDGVAVAYAVDHAAFFVRPLGAGNSIGYSHAQYVDPCQCQSVADGDAEFMTVVGLIGRLV